MSLTAAQIIELRAPAFYTDSRLTDLISLAEDGLSSQAFGSRYNEAVALQVCHWLEKENRGGASGPVSMEKEGELQRGYAASLAGDPGDLITTGWGTELQALIKSSILKPMNRMMGP